MENVIDSFEVHAGPYGPGNGNGLDSQNFLKFFDKIKGILCLPVQLVYEGEDGDTPHGAHLEELLGLGLDTLCSVDYHYG